jgi:hypothetical protein
MLGLDGLGEPYLQTFYEVVLTVCLAYKKYLRHRLKN